MSWTDLERGAPEIARSGRRLLEADGEVAIGFLATVSESGAPGLAPVCPIFCDGGLYLSAGTATPKRRHLEADGRYVLHAFLGEGDAEFQVAGRAVRVDDADERAAVHAAIRFGSYQADDPVFRLGVERALWGYWENPGQPDTRAIRKRWRAAS